MHGQSTHHKGIGTRPAHAARALALIVLCLSVLVAGCGGSAGGGGSSGDAEIALVVPLSGLYARQGQLVRAGADMAVDEINKQGGIEALDGKKVALRVEDTGETVQSAVTAANRALTEGGKPAGGIGSWLSSFTLGTTEVAERQHVPWVTLSFADPITERGFKYVYQTSAVSSAQAKQGLEQLMALAKQGGSPIKTIALVGDNTAATEAFFKSVRDPLAKQFGLQIVLDKVWSPPLGDASSIARGLRDRKPDAIIYGATNFTDSSQLLRSARQFGVTAPYIGSGAWLTTPDYVKGVGAKNVEGILAIVGASPLKGQERLVERFKQRTKEPFMIQDSLAGYYHVWMFKEAMELAKSADPEKVNDAIKRMDLTRGPAAETMPGGEVKFDPRGRRIGAIPVIAQWQDGVPVTVYPPQVAASRPTGLK